MVIRRKGKSIAMVIAVVLGIMAAIVVASWREVAVGYYLWRLGNDPAYLVEIVDARQGSYREAALVRFLIRPDGAERLLLTFVGELRKITPVREAFDKVPEIAAGEMTVSVNENGAVVSINDATTSMRRYRPAAVDAPLHALYKFLCRVRYDRYVVSDYPGYTFSVESLLESVVAGLDPKKEPQTDQNQEIGLGVSVEKKEKLIHEPRLVILRTTTSTDS